MEVFASCTKEGGIITNRLVVHAIRWITCMVGRSRRKQLS